MIDRVSGTRSPLGCSVLALNRMYMAVHVVPVRRAFCLLCKGTAEVVSVENGSWMAYDFGSWLEISELRAAMGEFDEHEDWIRSVSFDVQVPRVIRLLKYDRVPRNSVKFTRRNVFLRDDYTCQYCHKRFTVSNLSLDHVVPRSQSGKSTWDNIVHRMPDVQRQKRWSHTGAGQNVSETAAIQTKAKPGAGSSDEVTGLRMLAIVSGTAIRFVGNPI